MIEILTFIFSSFWVFLGTVILIGVTGTALVKFAVALRLLFGGGGL